MILDFLSQEENRFYKIVWKYFWSTKTKNIRCIDVPTDISDYNFKEKFESTIKSSWYNGVNVWITWMWAHPQYRDAVNALDLDRISYHGTSVKYVFKTGVSYSEVLWNDLKVLSGKHRQHINYDLYMWHPPELSFSYHFKSTQKENINQLCRKLKIQWIASEYAICDYIIDHLESIYKDTDHTLYLEIPWSKWWSMLPEINRKLLSHICNKMHTQKTSMKLCIDIWHVLTWGRTKKDIDLYIQMLELYAEDIWMIHISSAASYRKKFYEIYKLFYWVKYPPWHIQWLDLQWVISEPIMLYLLEKIRILLKETQIIEVSELRTPRKEIYDYFKIDDLSFIDETCYFDFIRKQSTLLSY